jgi:chemotaxis signal transduction protein
MQPDAAQSQSDFLVFSAAGQLFALACQDVIQVVDAPRHTSLPKMPECVRGVIDFMAGPVLLMDMRKRIGAVSARQENDELVKELAKRKQDHLGWIARLRAYIQGESQSLPETSPHKCAFGRWYDQYKTDHVQFASYLKRFDAPHRAIHGLAVETKRLMDHGQRDEAIAQVRAAEASELIQLVALFDTFEGQLRQSTHEYAVVVTSNGRTIALAVDRLETLDKLEALDLALPASAQINAKDLIQGMGRTILAGKAEDVFILDPSRLEEVGEA